MKKVGLLMIVVLGAASCGDDDSDGAKGKCRDLVTTFCSRVVECARSNAELMELYTPAELREECETSTAESARCENAVRIGANYGNCLEQSSSLACSDSNEAILQVELPIPQICENVILTQD